MSFKSDEQWGYVRRVLEANGEYVALEHLRQSREAEFDKAVKTLTPDQRAAIVDYFVICKVLAEHAVKVACFSIKD